MTFKHSFSFYVTCFRCHLDFKTGQNDHDVHCPSPYCLSYTMSITYRCYVTFW